METEVSTTLASAQQPPLGATAEAGHPDNILQCHRALIGKARFRLQDGRKLNYAYGLNRSPSEEGVNRLVELMRADLRRVENPIRIAIDPARLRNLEAIEANKALTEKWDTSVVVELAEDDKDAIDIMAGQLRLMSILKLCSMGPLTLEQDGWWWAEFYNSRNELWQPDRPLHSI